MARVACVQLAPVLGDVDANLVASTAAIAEAVTGGAQIVVLPELVTSGYMFTDADEACAAALAADDPGFNRWMTAAGVERGQRWAEGTVIINADGRVVAEGRVDAALRIVLDL